MEAMPGQTVSQCNELRLSLSHLSCVTEGVPGQMVSQCIELMMSLRCSLFNFITEGVSGQSVY